MEDNRTEEEKAQAQEKFDNLNPFHDGQSVTLEVTVSDRKAFWEFIAQNMYGPEEDRTIKGATLTTAHFDNIKQKSEKLIKAIEALIQEHRGF